MPPVSKLDNSQDGLVEFKDIQAIGSRIRNRMSSPLKLVLGIVLLLFAGFIAIKLVETIVVGLLGLIFHIAIPVAMVAGVAYIAFRMFSPKSLGFGRRTLP